MSSMFSTCYNFNQDIGQWDVSNVKRVTRLFSSAIKFNQDISNWDVSSVTNFSTMFLDALSFNQNLGSWDISAAQDMTYFFHRAGPSITNYDATLKGWSGLSNIPKNIEFGARDMEYCDEGEAARQILASNGWTFDGDSKSDDCD